MTLAINYPAVYRAPSGAAVLHTTPNPTENDTVYLSFDGMAFEPVNIITGGWHGAQNDERRMTFVVVPIDGYHADEYVPGATRYEWVRRLHADNLTIDGETYTYDPDTNFDELTIRKHPTVDYDADAYRVFHDEVRRGGRLLLSGLLGVKSTDHWPSFNVDRGDRVRGMYFLVTADPARLDGVLKTLSDELGREVEFATAYELMDFGISDWDGKTKIICAGTRISLRQSGGWNDIRPAYFALTSDDGGSVIAQWIEDFGPSQILCVVTT